MKIHTNKLLAGLLLLGLFCGLAMAATIVDPTEDQELTLNQNGEMTLSISLDEDANVTWTVDDLTKKTESNVSSSEYKITSEITSTPGSYTIKAILNEIGPERVWTLNVNPDVEPLKILSDSIDPNTDPTSEENISQTFSIKTNKAADIIWSIDGTEVDSKNDVTEHTYENNSAAVGEHEVKVVAQNGTETDDYTWKWTVKEESKPELSIQNPQPDNDPESNFKVNQTFSIETNQISNITWFIDGVEVDSKNDVTEHTYENNSAAVGEHEVKVVAQNGTETDDYTWKWTVKEESKPELSIQNPQPDNDPESNFKENQTFSIETNQISNITWFIDGVEVDSKNDVTEHTYENNSAAVGEHEVKVVAQNGTETDDYTWKWTVSQKSLNITENPAEGNVEISEGESQTFNVSSDNIFNIEWFVDGDSQDDANEDNVNFSSFTYEDATSGEYNITAEVSDPNGTYSSRTIKWTLQVRSKYYSTGNRIWEDGAGLSNVYIWTPQSYSGFYYDLDSGEGAETMTITLDGDSGDVSRTIEDGNLVYETSPIPTDFEYGSWGKYQVIGFMAEKYFAGYIDSGDDENKTTVGNEDLDANLIDEGVLAKVLTDSDDKESIYSGSDLVLEDGYSLNIVEVDVNGDQVWVQLEKDGDVVEDQFLGSGDDFIYEADLGDAEDVPIIIAHFGTVFAGQETSAVFVEGIFQISDNYIEIESGDSFGEMEVDQISSDLIKMENEDSISLKKGDTIDIMGKLQIIVADADDDVLRFAPIVEMSEAGTYELRGTVFDKDKSEVAPEWTPLNFEGFYYDIDEGLGTESLVVDEDKFDVDGRDIDDGGLEYRTETNEVEFENSDWGNFTVIGFMAEKYFAGYPEGAVNGEIDDDVSILGDGYLSKVLADSDDKESMYSGSALVLEEGYSLEIQEVDINGETVWVQLQKDGDDVEDAFLASGEDYVYEGELGDAEDVPLIIVHFGTVFAGQETSAVFVEGIFQVSDDYIEIENGDTFGEMEVDSIGDDEIVMTNDDNIDLGEDDTIDLMGNVKFKVADDDTLRFYPFVEVETEGSGSASRELKISVPDEIFVDEEIEIEVTADDKAVEDVTVKLDGKSIGKTDEDGILSYTSTTTGDFKVTAVKDGYTTANKNMEVLEQKEEMSISVSPETAYEGERVTIEVLKAIGGDAIEDANVSINGEILGKTDSDGTISYTASTPGRISITAVKEGFLDQDINFNVKALEAIFVYSNLVAPIEIKAEKEAEISIAVENTGNAAGETEVELRVNGSFVDSQMVSLGIGESTTVTFLHAEEVPGSYTIEAGDQTTTYEVTKKTSVLLYALLTLILLVGGGAAYMFTKGGMTVADLQEKIAELTGKKPKE